MGDLKDRIVKILKESMDNSSYGEVAELIVTEVNKPSIFEYFQQMLGRDPSDKTLRELPMESECGDGCKTAIDKASAFMEEIDRAFGNDAPVLKDNVIEACDEVVTCYWRG